MRLTVIAKEPRPGFAKTRLCPPCTPESAAAIAAASLRDTLAAVGATPASRRLLVLDGRPGRWLPRGFTVAPQVEGDLGARLDAAFQMSFGDGPDEPVVLVGMDTPQVRPAHLTAAADALETGADAVIGPATDGGYWSIGFRRFVPGAFVGVPMSTADTGRAQVARLRALGCRVALVDELRDVDHVDDAVAVAGMVAGSAFASAVDVALS